MELIYEKIRDVNTKIYNTFEEVRKGITTIHDGRIQIELFLTSLSVYEDVIPAPIHIIFPLDALTVEVKIMYIIADMPSKKYYNAFLLGVHPNGKEALALLSTDEFLCSDVKPRGKFVMDGAISIYNQSIPHPEPDTCSGCCADTIIVVGNDVIIEECPRPIPPKDFVTVLNAYLYSLGLTYTIRANENNAIVVHLTSIVGLPAFWTDPSNIHPLGFYVGRIDGKYVFLYEGMKQWFGAVGPVPQSSGPFFNPDFSSLLLYVPNQFEAYIAPNTTRVGLWTIDLLYAAKCKESIPPLYKNIRNLTTFYRYDAGDVIPAYRQSLVAYTGLILNNRMISFGNYNREIQHYLKPCDRKDRKPDCQSCSDSEDECDRKDRCEPVCEERYEPKCEERCESKCDKKKNNKNKQCNDEGHCFKY